MKPFIVQMEVSYWCKNLLAALPALPWRRGGSAELRRRGAAPAALAWRLMWLLLRLLAWRRSDSAERRDATLRNAMQRIVSVRSVPEEALPGTPRTTNVANVNMRAPHAAHAAPAPYAPYERIPGRSTGRSTKRSDGLQRRSAEFARGSKRHGKDMARTWQRHGKGTAKTWQRHGNSQERHGKDMATTWQGRSINSPRLVWAWRCRAPSGAHEV